MKGDKKKATQKDVAQMRTRLRKSLPSESWVEAVLHGNATIPSGLFNCPKCETNYPPYYRVGHVCLDCWINSTPLKYLNPSN